jgi:hypothetical protein
MKKYLFASAALGAVSVNALIFPQTTTPYDYSRYATSPTAAKNEGFAIGTVGYTYAALTGVAVGPKWILSTGHSYGDTWIDPSGTYTVGDDSSNPKVSIGGFNLHKVLNGTLPFYSPLRKSAPTVGNKFTVISLGSSSLGSAVLGTDSVIKGWTYDYNNPFGYGWRKGYGRISSVNSSDIFWPFTATDSEFGEQCAAVVFGDSGSP